MTTRNIPPTERAHMTDNQLFEETVLRLAKAAGPDPVFTTMTVEGMGESKLREGQHVISMTHRMRGSIFFAVELVDDHHLILVQVYPLEGQPDRCAVDEDGNTVNLDITKAGRAHRHTVREIISFVHRQADDSGVAEIEQNYATVRGPGPHYDTIWVPIGVKKAGIFEAGTLTPVTYGPLVTS